MDGPTTQSGTLAGLAPVAPGGSIVGVGSAQVTTNASAASSAASPSAGLPIVGVLAVVLAALVVLAWLRRG